MTIDKKDLTVLHADLCKVSHALEIKRMVAIDSFKNHKTDDLFDWIDFLTDFISDLCDLTERLEKQLI